MQLFPGILSAQGNFHFILLGAATPFSARIPWFSQGGYDYFSSAVDFHSVLLQVWKVVSL